MLGDLSGKTALITGAGSRRGMGAPIAAALARQGADVAVTDVDLDSAAGVAAELAGAETLALRPDFASWDSVRTAVAEVVARWERLDILVNNAGVGPPDLAPEKYADDPLDVPSTSISRAQSVA